MTREEVIAYARGWIGVPYLHQGRTRAGVDCLGFAINVGWWCGAIPHTFDRNDYERSPDGTLFAECDERLIRVPGPRLGCWAVMRFAEEPQHIAIVADYRYGGFSIIHALQNRQRNAANTRGKVAEHRLDGTWRERVIGWFDMPGVE